MKIKCMYEVPSDEYYIGTELKKGLAIFVFRAYEEVFVTVIKEDGKAENFYLKNVLFDTSEIEE